MATTVAKGEYYKWDTANFTWDAVQAAHTYDDFAPLVYTRDDAEIFGILDRALSSTEKVSSDTIHFAGERLWSGACSVFSEGVGVTDAYLYTSLAKNITESIRTSDKMCSRVGKMSSDATSLRDARPRSDIYGLKAEHIGVHETYWDLISYIMRILESARVIESAHRAVSIPKSEDVGIASASHSSVAKSSNERLGTIDVYLYTSFTKQSGERVSVKDSRDASLTHVSKDKASVHDDIAASVDKMTAERLRASDAELTVLAKLVAEYVKTTDALSAAVTHMSYDDVAASDGLTISLGKMTAEQLGILDTELRAAAFRRTWDESAQLEDDEDNHVTANKFEEVQTTDCRSADIYQPEEEAVGIADRQIHRARTLRTFDEKANVGEHMWRDLGGSYSEAVDVDDRFLRALNGIIEEITLKKGGMTAADFQQLVNQPTGYERFIPYIVGEYEYQKALVRLAVTPGSLGAEPAVYNVVVHVDIDDTVDRGTTIITDTSAATTVHFSKHYYTRPEVTVTLRGGSTADGIITPNVTEIDKDKDGYFFKVELLKSDGTRAKGTITWQSVGY